MKKSSARLNNIKVETVNLADIDSPLAEMPYNDFTDLNSPLLEALKMDKSKSANIIEENEFEFGLGLNEADEDDLLQNPLDGLEEADLLESAHASLVEVPSALRDTSKMSSHIKPFNKDISLLKLDSRDSDTLLDGSPLIPLTALSPMGKVNNPLLSNEIDELVP